MSESDDKPHVSAIVPALLRECQWISTFLNVQISFMIIIANWTFVHYVAKDGFDGT